MYRWSDLDFEANARDGIAVDWPIRHADVAPWHDYVEAFIGVSGQKEGLAHLPDGPFLPPMPFNCVEQHVADRIGAAFPGERLVTIGRAAVLTAPHNGRAACHYCGPCHRGCVTRSYFSAPNATLPAAEATGRLTLRPFSVVRDLVLDRLTKKVSGVHVIDARTRASIEFRARVVFLCASALESARILLVHVLVNGELVGAPRAVDVEHRNTPRIHHAGIHRAAVSRVGQRLAEAVQRHHPRAELGEALLQARDRSRERDARLPLLAKPAPLEAEAPHDLM